MFIYIYIFLVHKNKPFVFVTAMTLKVRTRSSTEQIVDSLADILPPGCLEEGCSSEGNCKLKLKYTLITIYICI